TRVFVAMRGASLWSALRVQPTSLRRHSSGNLARGADFGITGSRASGLAVARGVGVEEAQELLTRDHHAPPELDRRDRALVDTRGDRARIDAEGFGGFFAGDDQAAPCTQVFHIESAL